MKIKTDNLYLMHILDSSERIENYLGEVSTQESFSKSQIHQDAIMRHLGIIGEAVKKLSPELKEKYSDFPWSKAAAMRDKLIHDYVEIDLDIIWDTVTNDLPELNEKVKEILAKSV